MIVIRLLFSFISLSFSQSSSHLRELSPTFSTFLAHLTRNRISDSPIPHLHYSQRCLIFLFLLLLLREAKSEAIMEGFKNFLPQTVNVMRDGTFQEVTLLSNCKSIMLAKVGSWTLFRSKGGSGRVETYIYNRIYPSVNYSTLDNRKNNESHCNKAEEKASFFFWTLGQPHVLFVANTTRQCCLSAVILPKLRRVIQPGAS